MTHHPGSDTDIERADVSEHWYGGAGIGNLKNLVGNTRILSPHHKRDRRCEVGEGVVFRCFFSGAYYLASAALKILHGVEKRVLATYRDVQQRSGGCLDGIGTDTDTAAGSDTTAGIWAMTP